MNITLRDNEMTQNLCAYMNFKYEVVVWMDCPYLNWI